MQDSQFFWKTRGSLEKSGKFRNGHGKSREKAKSSGISLVAENLQFSFFPAIIVIMSPDFSFDGPSFKFRVFCPLAACGELQFNQLISPYYFIVRP